MENTKEFVEDFAEKLVERLKGKGLSIDDYSINKIYKINDTFKTGLVIKEFDSNCSPTMYIDHYKDDIANNKCTLEDALNDALNFYINARPSDEAQLLSLSEAIPTNVRYTIRMCNYERNKHYLENAPIKMLNEDFALYIVGELPSESTTVLSFVVKNNLLEKIGLSEEELFNKAYKNLCEEKFTIQPLMSVIHELLGLPNEICPIDESQYQPYVVTNEHKILGSVVIARNDILQQFAEAHGDFYILPCSLHELILVPAIGDMCSEQLIEMVRTVNSNELQESDFLSDTIYFYSQNELKALQ